MGRKATGILLGASMFASIYQLFCCSPEGDLLKPAQIVLRTALHLATLLREEHDCLIVRVSIGVQRVKYLSSNRLQCSTMDVSIIGKRLLHRLCSECWECCLSVTFSGAKKNGFQNSRPRAIHSHEFALKHVQLVNPATKLWHPSKLGDPKVPMVEYESQNTGCMPVSFLETLNINYWLHHVTSLPFNLKIFPIHIYIYIHTHLSIMVSLILLKYLEYIYI